MDVMMDETACHECFESSEFKSSVNKSKKILKSLIKQDKKKM